MRGSLQRWGYCKLEATARLLNQPATNNLDVGAVEKEIQTGMRLAAQNPKLEQWGKALLDSLRKRRDGSTTTDDPPVADDSSVTIRHLDKNGDGWAVTETANFRIFHKEDRELAEKVARAAERTRQAMQRQWCGSAADNWNPLCEIYLHATAQDYSKATSKPTESPGHSTLKTDSGRLVLRRIDLHIDEATMLTVTLPHETTHVVLADLFAAQPPPRWADEGIAVLAEPRERVARYLQNLEPCRRNGKLIHCDKLMTLEDYPLARQINPFYCQSVSLVQFLVKEKGPRELALCLLESQRYGMETALKRHYGFSDFTDLERRWELFAFGENLTPAGVAQGSRP
jgi:hypothetical protein